jgi:hypothetical protein
MGDVSNKTIVGLLMVALVITVVGTVISVNKINSMDSGYLDLTGAATSTSGTTTLQVDSNTAIVGIVTALDFGNGYVNSSDTACVLNSEGQRESNASCVGFNNLTQGFLIENTGNKNVSLNMSCTGNCSAADFIGGTSPEFNYKVTSANTANDQSGQSSSNDTAVSCDEGWHNATYSPVGQLNTNAYYICGDATSFNFSYGAALDAVVVDFNVTIPDDANQTGSNLSATFTFVAAST